MIRELFNTITSKDKSDAVERLIAHSSPSHDFFLMAILSVSMAALGLLTDNAPVVVGSMLVAPMLYPVLSLAMGIITSDYRLVSRSSMTIVKSLFLGAAIAFVIAIFFRELYTNSLIALIHPSLIQALIAAIAGLAASFALIKPQMNETLPGVAIAVTLVPPIAALGIGLAHADTTLMTNAFLLFVLNTLGVVFTSMIVFSLTNFYLKKNEVAAAITQEEKELKKEEAAPKK